MTLLDELKPTSKPNLIDLLYKAGVNVKDWANFKGGIAKAASNPKYCYEWSFLEANKVVVVNLWYAELKVKNGRVSREFNLRALSSSTLLV
jgi:5-methylcytosine-specific restriction protein A